MFGGSKEEVIVLWGGGKTALKERREGAREPGDKGFLLFRVEGGGVCPFIERHGERGRGG